MKPEHAINEAFRTLKPIPMQPNFGHAVPLRELWYALERVSGMPDSKALAELHRALSTGILPADAINDDGDRRIIPSNQWPRYDADNNTWYCGKIFLEHDLPTFKGFMPIVSRQNAIKWLEHYVEGPKAGRPNKTDAALKAYQTVYQGTNHMEQGDAWKTALRNVNQRLRDPVSLQTLKRAVAKK